MAKNCLFLYVIFSIFLISCNISPEYSLNIPPPPNTAWPEDIYPDQIYGIKAVVSTKEYGGKEAKYGNDKSIYVARMSTKEEAISFFRENILPEFDSLPSNYCGIVDNQFYAKANENGKTFYGWVNNRYIFVLKGYSDKAFNELIDNFAYISRK